MRSRQTRYRDMTIAAMKNDPKDISLLRVMCFLSVSAAGSKGVQAAAPVA